MMEIKTIDDVKKEIGNKVKFAKGESVSENLKSLDVLEGNITKVISTWDHTIDGDVCRSWTANIDVVDPKDGGLHHLTTDKVFTIEEKDDTIINIKAIEEIAELQAKITVLESKMVVESINGIEEEVGP
jgi:hypothetical protein